MESIHREKSNKDLGGKYVLDDMQNSQVWPCSTNLIPTFLICEIQFSTQTVLFDCLDGRQSADAWSALSR